MDPDKMQTAAARGWGKNFSSYVGLSSALLGMIVLFSILSKHFFTYETFVTIANQIPDLLVMAVGMTLVLMIGGIDLSVGSVLAVTASVVSIGVLQWHLPPLMAALIGILVATLFGCLTGTVTVAWQIPSFIVSLGVLEIARGLAYQLTNSRTSYIGSVFEHLANPFFARISLSFIIAIAVMLIAQLVLTRTVFGRYLTAIGTNEEAVRLTGIDPRPYKVIVFGLMGALAGLAALFQISRLEAADPNAGVGIELQVIAAVVIGGTSLMGGQGSVISTFFGVLIISVLAAGLAQIGATEPTKRIITGLVIVIAVILDAYRGGRFKQRK